ncbi:MAG: hypothetical protein ACK5JF_00100 [Oscillospiraceae bacterium]
MANTFSISSPQLLVFNDNGTSFYGADQDWYTQKWQQQAGCGPTVCSQLFWYLSQTKPGYDNLCKYDAQQKEGIALLMHDVWDFVTPGKYGTNSTKLFISGAMKYANEKQVALSSSFLDMRKSKRDEDVQKMAEFVQNSLAQNLPVAFINLSNGKEDILESWHWVVIVGFSPDTMVAECYDNGNRLNVNLKNWLATTLMGGICIAIPHRR